MLSAYIKVLPKRFLLRNLLGRTFSYFLSVCNSGLEREGTVVFVDCFHYINAFCGILNIQLVSTVLGYESALGRLRHDNYGISWRDNSK